MAKTLKELVEGWAKSPADKKFLDKIHPVKDNGDKPDVKTKKITRKPRMGYDTPEDEITYDKTQKDD